MKYTHEQIVEFRKELKEMAHAYWMENTFLSWEWWLLLGFTIIPWLIWWKIADKKRLDELLFYGLIICILTIFLDSIGSNLVWWSYPKELYEVIPPLAPVDITLVPCIMMLVYQFFRSWKSYIIATLLVAFVSTYGGETFFIWIGYFKRFDWQPFHSILFYLIAGVIGKWLIVRIQSTVFAHKGRF